MIKNTLVLGLTGGIACGKSTVARFLGEAGARIIDADQVARRVVAVGSDGLAAIVAAFGDAMLTADGSLDRARMGELVFADEAARRRLNQITHPRIAIETQRQIHEAADADTPVVVYDAPLLLESGAGTSWLDAVIVVAAAEETQIARMASRDKFSVEAARARIASQMPLADKRAAADYVVENDGSIAELRGAVDRLLSELNTRFSVNLVLSQPER